MKLTLLRYPSLQDATLGGLLVDGRLQCFSLEDAYRPVKIPGRTRIPPGTYMIELQTAGRLHDDYKLKYQEHRGMLHLMHVPDFEGIMIHILNTHLQTDGCIGVGDMSMIQGEIAQSVVAYRKLYGLVSNAILSGEGATIEVRDYE